MAAEVFFVATGGGIWIGRVFLAAGGLIWLLWALGALYLFVLAVAAALFRRTLRAVAPASTTGRKFCLLIPAHNEELLLGEVIDRLGSLDYPAGKFATVVIADNCDDNTAGVARECGAGVLERTDPERLGKGYALVWALDRLLADSRRFDAFVFLDSDSILSDNFLKVMDGALNSQAGAIQAHYNVLNAGESWRTRLMACALALAHYVKPGGRMALGLSDGLKGNGMCFSRELLERVPWSGESITEDIDYTIRLVLEGEKIEFTPEAVVSAQMPVTARQASTQRQRWEGGRYGLLRRAFGLLAEGLRCRKMTVIDRAVELIIPPFAELFLVPALAVIGAGIWMAADPGSSAARLALILWLFVVAVLTAYLALGLAVARVPARVAASLLYAPIYIMWKLVLYGAMLFGRGASGWNRTERRKLEDPADVR